MIDRVYNWGAGVIVAIIQGLSTEKLWKGVLKRWMLEWP